MRVLHLLDSTCGWEQRLAITQMLDRFDPKMVGCVLASIDPSHSAALVPQADVVPLPRRLALPALAAPAIRLLNQSERFDIIHAWGAPAAAAARAALPESSPLVISIFDPGPSSTDMRILLTVQASGRCIFACAAERVRRRMVEQGVAFDSCAVIRPGVDFKTIREVKNADLRAQLGIDRECFVAIAPEPPTDRGGHRSAIWAVAMHAHLNNEIRLLIPGDSNAIADLRRLALSGENPDSFVFTKAQYRFEELLAAADVLIYGGVADVSTTAIAWAMAAGVTVVSPATYCVAELLSNDLNGILFKAEELWTRRGRQICVRLAKAREAAKLREVARGQAYAVFSVRRSVDQHRQLYDNILAAAAPSHNISDPATVSA
jgi:glycosyltransferase involved in cell wall biosynthesis